MVRIFFFVLSSHVSIISIINLVFVYYLGLYIKSYFSLKNRAPGKESCGSIITARVNENRDGQSLIPIPSYPRLAASLVLPVVLVTIFSFPVLEILQTIVLSAVGPIGPINRISPVDRSMIEGLGR